MLLTVLLIAEPALGPPSLLLPRKTASPAWARQLILGRSCSHSSQEHWDFCSQTAMSAPTASVLSLPSSSVLPKIKRGQLVDSHPIPQSSPDQLCLLQSFCCCRAVVQAAQASPCCCQVRGSYQRSHWEQGDSTRCPYTAGATSAALVKTSSHGEGLVLEVPGPVSSFEVGQEEADDQDSVWLCHKRGKCFLSVSPGFPKALVQSRRSTGWSLAAPDVKGDPQGFGRTWPAATPNPLSFLLLSSGGHTSAAESTSLSAPAAGVDVNVSL